MDGVKDLMTICEKKKVSTNFGPSVGCVQVCNALFLKRDGSTGKIVATQAQGPEFNPENHPLNTHTHTQNQPPQNNKTNIKQKQKPKCSIVAHAGNHGAWGSRDRAPWSSLINQPRLCGEFQANKRTHLKIKNGR